MAKKKASVAKKMAPEPTISPEAIEMRADQFLLWQTWCAILKHNAHRVRDARLNIEIAQLSITFLVPNPETLPLVIQMLVLDFDDDEVTASLTSFTRKTMRAQGEGFTLLRTATFNWTASSPSFPQFLADFDLNCPMTPPDSLPPGYFYSAD
ncbi:MAG: hypothetical protein K8U57_14885 [Planctomycetes bacterium]|nr:hypothetical protein [Planctomycetota bacterium]